MVVIVEGDDSRLHRQGQSLRDTGYFRWTKPLSLGRGRDRGGHGPSPWRALGVAQVESVRWK
jgi:hypothetical protein